MNKKIYVWDLGVRVFHWSLVALFGLSYLTGDDETWLHIYSGYAIFALVLMRIVWGLVGSRYARFSEFIRSPAVVLAYTKSMLAAKPKHYLGHNPLGGLMVITMLLALLVTTLSGMKLYAIDEGKGPFAEQHSVVIVERAQADDHKGITKTKRDKTGKKLWKEIHEVAVNLMIFLILVHIGGVAISSRLHRTSLVKSMLTGYKDKGE